MSEILDKIYDRSIVVLFWNSIFQFFLEIVETYFLTKNYSKPDVYVFVLSKKQQNWFQKNFRNSGVVGDRRLSNAQLSNVCLFVYDISFHLNYLILTRSTSLQVSHQNLKVSREKINRESSRLAYEIFQLLKPAVRTTF